MQFVILKVTSGGEEERKAGRMHSDSYWCNITKYSSVTTGLNQQVRQQTKITFPKVLSLNISA